MSHRVSVGLQTQPGTDSRHRPRPGHHAEHDRHDRRRAVHHHPADHQPPPAGRRPCSAGFSARSSRSATDWCGPNWARPCPRPAARIIPEGNLRTANRWDACSRSSSSGSCRSARRCRSPRAASAWRTMRAISGPGWSAHSSPHTFHLRIAAARHARSRASW